MTTIRTNCPTCGEVDMSPEAVLLSVRDIAGEGSYRFSCPECRKTVEKPADRKVVALLLSAGVELDEETEPAAAPTVPAAFYEERPDGPPFTIDDVITFHFLLEDDEELFRSLRSA